ncbi:MAG: glycosyltransferase [Acidobacteria bacterium]|nr:glycosyltransferase [Acidobacteriota bacterium]
MGFYLTDEWAVRSKAVLNKIIKNDIITLTPKNKSRGRVLLSYLTNHFRFHINKSYIYSHSNQWECTQIAQAWLDNGYTVDIIDWDNNHFIPKKDYEFFIDIHSNMERLAPLMKEDCRKILHITGAHWLFQNTAEYSRLLSLQKRKKVTLFPRRTVQPSRGIEYADCATILGNSFTQGTFAFSKKQLYPIRLSSNVQYPFFENKEFRKIRKNFLWFGGGGLVHKGLDLVLEAFEQMPEYELTVCGSVDQEPDFKEAYHKELDNTPNIHTVGWIDVNSKQFSTIISQNVGLIYPSCSEGQAGSVITCLHAGLIPIISYESGVDLPNFGIVLHDANTSEIKQAIEQVSNLPDSDLLTQSRNAWDYARKNHTQEQFKKDYYKFVDIMISTMRV